MRAAVKFGFNKPDRAGERAPRARSRQRLRSAGPAVRGLVGDRAREWFQASTLGDGRCGRHDRRPRPAGRYRRCCTERAAAVRAGDNPEGRRRGPGHDGGSGLVRHRQQPPRSPASRSPARPGTAELKDTAGKKNDVKDTDAWFVATPPPRIQRSSSARCFPNGGVRGRHRGAGGASGAGGRAGDQLSGAVVVGPSGHPPRERQSFRRSRGFGGARALVQDAEWTFNPRSRQSSGSGRRFMGVAGLQPADATKLEASEWFALIAGFRAGAGRPRTHDLGPLRGRARPGTAGPRRTGRIRSVSGRFE